MRRAVEVVGVFVNPTLDELARAAEDESLAMLQLHGDEGPDFCREAARRTGWGDQGGGRQRGRGARG